jgi:hypothetical protein
VLHPVALEINANISPLSFRTEQISATVETMSISRFPSYLSSHDPDLPTAFYNRFRESRESFGVSRERQVLDLLGGDMGWKRLNKPWFKRDSLTEVIYRRSPTTRLSPNGRVTVCIPYRLTFVVAVSHDGFTGPCIPTRQTADVRCRLGNIYNRMQCAANSKSITPST